MGRNLKIDDSKPRDLIPAGNYLGRIVGIYCIGTQDGGQYEPKEQCIITWELSNKKGPVRDGEGRSLTISNFYTLSMNEKANLRRDLETILGADLKAGDDFDVESVLGTPCRLSVAHVEVNGKTRERIKALMALDPDDPKPSTEMDEVYFDCLATSEIPAGVPGWVAKFVERSVEWRDREPLRDAGGKVVAGRGAKGPVDDDDSTPF